ncbi:MarR family transcriptional regulator [Oleiharenicola lentus]|jgi:DNA-binding MarR family transcriptional regulator|uniref:MarR family transcriptional regulator n=1 Tax=Oleiharenicola lentus TaxID=2508720 RepID=A0A4Q1C985_9BACT|nr:MarR family transcriptional regulator [Oleiharenicola lentus]RXK55534.1 MarR family transcriptional regulator [Oleiharenicola lentus]
MPHLLLKDLPRYECLLEAAREFPDLDPSAAEAFLHLLRTGDEVFAMTERNLTDHSISHGRFGVLMLLWRSTQPRAAKLMGAEDCTCGGPRTPAELAEAAGVTRATMTGLIDTLERDGFVKREPDPDDRRMMSVRLTPKGDRFLNDFLPGHFKVIAEVLSPLSENERKSLVRILTKVQAHIAVLRVENAAQPAVS